MGAIPSAISALPDLAKEVKIGEVLGKAADQITDLANNAVQNFKDLASGKLPKIDIPNLGDLTSSLFAKIDPAKLDLVKEFNSLADTIGNEINSFGDFLDQQISCVENDYLKDIEVSSIEGNLMNNISKNVKKLTNNQLRDFTLNTAKVDGAALQAEFSKGISDQAINIQKSISQQGKTFTEQANTQVTALDSFSKLDIEIPDLSSITKNLV